MGTVQRDFSTLTSSPPKYSLQELKYWWKEEAKFDF